jgi:hypothetical protein
VINVGHGQGQRSALPQAAIPFTLEHLIELPPVREARKRIDFRHDQVEWVRLVLQGKEYPKELRSGETESAYDQEVQETPGVYLISTCYFNGPDVSYPRLPSYGYPA